ncbi:MAG: hypothetical protein IT236_09610 [Bacteroidia bacterium]|nr:hypothetical protein [Bacteroidia bacterium]
MAYKKLIALIPFLLGLISGLFFISLNVTGSSFEFFPGDYIDGRFNNYLLEHAHRFFTGQQKMFWNAPYLFPEENVITYSDNLLGSAPFYSLFRLLGANRETAFQFWFLLVSVLNYAACYVLLNYLFKNNYAAVCGAMVFAFSMALHSQMGHAQTFPRFAAPLAIWMLLRFMEELKPRYFFWAVFFLAYQLYCGIYLGFLLAVPFGLMLAFVCYHKWAQLKEFIRQKKWLLQILGGGTANVLLLLPLMLPYFERARQTGFYPYENVLQSIPTLGSYFFSWKGSLCWDTLSETCISYPAFWDHEIFAGALATLSFFGVSALLIIALFYKRVFPALQQSLALKIVLLTGLLTFVIFLRVGDFSIYRIIYAVPGFGSMRALQRIINIELMFFAVALACWVNWLTAKKNKVSAVLSVVLLVLIIADNYMKPGFIHQRVKAESQQRIDEVQKKMQHIDKDAIVSYEPDTLLSSPMDYHLDAMLAAQALGITTLNGYSATSPGGYGPYWIKPNEESRKIWLERKGVRWVKVSVVK